MTPIHPNCGNCGCDDCPQNDQTLIASYDCATDTLTFTSNGVDISTGDALQLTGDGGSNGLVDGTHYYFNSPTELVVPTASVKVPGTFLNIAVLTYTAFGPIAVWGGSIDVTPC